MSLDKFPRLKVYLKYNPPNVLLWRDTLYVRYRDGSSVSISLLSKLAEVVDQYLQGKVSEIVVESEYVDAKMDIDEAKFLGQGLVAEYLFYEGSGNVLHDSSGNGNDGTISGATWKQLPNGKYYLEFDSVDDKVTTPVNPANWSALTFEIVFRLSNYTGAAQRPGGAYGIFEIAIPKDNDRLWLGIYTKENGKLYAIPLDVTPTDILDKWTHITLVFGGSFKGYRNGAVKATGTIPFTAHLRVPAVTKYVMFGMLDSTLPFTGDIAIGRVFNRQLSDTEVELFYKLAKIMVPELP